MGKLVPVKPADGCAWVTGASSGIGRAVAVALARDGWRVAVSARGRDGLVSLIQETAGLNGSVHPYPLDVTNPQDVAETYAAICRDLGPVALSILNAGIYLPVEIRGHVDPAPFAQSMQVNYMGVVHCLAPLLPDLIVRRRGHVVIVSSVTGYGGLPRAAAYGPTKAALINLAQTLWLDLSDRGIGVSVVNPGFVETPLTAQNDFRMPALLTPEQAADEILAGWAAGRFEIHFPKRFTLWVKALSHLGDASYFRAVRRATGL